jgi:hypothetical protein
MTGPPCKRGSPRHRACAQDRPAVAGKTGGTTPPTGWLVHRLFERDHHRGLDGPRRCAADPGPLQGGRAPARRSTTSCRAVASRPSSSSNQGHLPNWQVRRGRELDRRTRRFMLVDPEGIRSREGSGPRSRTRWPGRTRSHRCPRRKLNEEWLDRDEATSPPPRDRRRHAEPELLARAADAGGAHAPSRVEPRRPASVLPSSFDQAWNCGAWFMCTRCATSCATVARLTQSGARISRQL